MTPEKIHFTKEKETMLMTLNSRAIQNQWKNPILRDPWAEEAMRHIDYDISQTYKGVGSWSMWKDIGCTIIATRAATFDLLTSRYLAEHPDVTVLHVGCGMDSRVFRFNPPASVRWFDHARFVQQFGLCAGTGDIWRSFLAYKLALCAEMVSN